MKPLFRFGILLLLAATWFSGCGAQTSPQDNTALPSPTPPPVSIQPDSMPSTVGAAPSTTNSPRLLTYADNDQTISLRVGEPFALELGPSAGSVWLIRVADPNILEPPIHELGPEGNRIVLEPVKSGETTISANSHAICERPGPCPEVFLFFTLRVKVLAD
jgi:hypothetical protein